MDSTKEETSAPWAHERRDDYVGQGYERASINIREALRRKTLSFIQSGNPWRLVYSFSTACKEDVIDPVFEKERDLLVEE